jgi:3-oxoacyl-[acyl-carrier protein] reductase
MGTLENKVAVVTGAGQGIGLAYAQRLAREGARIVVADIDSSLGERASKTIGDTSPAIFVHTDVSDPASAEACTDATVREFGRLDILINNAGLYGNWDTGDQTLEYLRRMFDINLHGCWLMAGAAAPHMVRCGGGRIINQASGAAYNYTPATVGGEYEGLPSFNYQQSKWGVVGLTKYLAGYLGAWGITVNCIAPGVIATDATLAKIPREMLDRLAGQQAVPGTIMAEDLCGAAAFFASDEARFITGQVLVIDGGRHMPA